MLRKLNEWANNENFQEVIKKTMGINDNKEQNNYCAECRCNCSCDAGCKGDANKCTSMSAIIRECTHCCQCYLIAGELERRNK